MMTTPRHMQGKARSVILRPRRRITIDVPSSEKPNDIVFVTCGHSPFKAPSVKRSGEKKRGKVQKHASFNPAKEEQQGLSLVSATTPVSTLVAIVTPGTPMLTPLAVLLENRKGRSHLLIL